MVRTATESPDNYCRICKCDFRTYVGNFKKIIHASTLNLFIPSQRKENFGVVLSDLCAEVGLPLVKSKDYSTKVCRLCSRKITKAHELHSELKSSVNVKNQKLHPVEVYSKGSIAEKRKLLTPDRGISPNNRKLCRTKSPEKSSSNSQVKRKCLFGKSAKESEEKENADCANEEFAAEGDDVTKDKPNVAPINQDEVLHKLNIDGLKTCEGGRSHLKLKVVLVHPNGDVVVRNPTDEKTVQIIRNIVVGGWTAVANAVFEHQDEELQEALRLAIQRKVNKEFKVYCKSKSVLKATEPEDLAAFSNKLVVTEARAYCPFWYMCLTGAVGVKKKNLMLNQLALATSIVARARNRNMSAISYRLSNLLIHSGATFQDITRLSRLGVCMSPVSTIRIQHKMGNFFDVKLLKWKSTIEDNKNCVNLLKETLHNQKPIDHLNEDSMDLEVHFDLSEEVVKHYHSYTIEAHDEVKSSLEKHPQYCDITSCSEEILWEEISRLEGQKLPLYK